MVLVYITFSLGLNRTKAQEEISNQGSNFVKSIENAEDEMDSVDEGSPSNEAALENDRNADSFKDGISKVKSYLKTKIKGSQLSVKSSEERTSISGSEVNGVATPSTSCGSRTPQLKESRSRTATPMHDSSNICFITNKDEIERCDHRLKLYFAMDLFKDDNEDFRCMIQV